MFIFISYLSSLLSSLFKSTVLKADSEQGQGMTEYALLLVLVAVVVISILIVLGPQLNQVWMDVWVGLSGVYNVTGSGNDWQWSCVNGSASGSASTAEQAVAAARASCLP
jgi:pilus assembly protein Flp/PilA